MAECIRREHAYWTTCPCDPCSLDRRRKIKAYRVYGYKRPAADAAWDRIDQWLAEGFTATWIASAAGISDRGIETALQDRRDTGHPRAFGPVITSRILKADIWAATRGRCSARGTARRLQALAMMGWDSASLADETGISFVSLCALQRGAIEATNPITRNAVAEAYERLADTRGPSRLAHARAVRKGYLPPLAWDDIDNDPDPATLSHIEPVLDEVAIERRMAGDKSVRLTTAERDELARRWYESDRANNDCWRVTGINLHRHIRQSEVA